MKIKVDENLPESLARSLCELGHVADTVREENLAGSSDSEIWRIAQLEVRFLVTQDVSFSDVRKFAAGMHHGILLLRLHPAARLGFKRRVIEIFRTENIDDWRGCLVVATETKVRVVRT
jgi:predicted nuclease of predicted toxin-antitoxin system